MQDCGVEVVDMDFVFDDAVGRLAGFLLRQTTLDIATGQEDRIAIAIVFSTRLAGT